MDQFGQVTKTTFLKSQEHKLSNEFEVEVFTQTLTLDADFVASNTITGYVDGVQITQAFDTDHATTMAALADKIAALSGVSSATVSSARVITVTPVDQEAGISLVAFTITGGASQAGVTEGISNNNIKKGQPVKLTTDGKVVPLASGDDAYLCIGVALQDRAGGELVTVVTRGYLILFATSAAAHNAGPAVFTGYDTSNNRPEVDDGGSATTTMGWLIDDAAGAGEKVRILVKD